MYGYEYCLGETYFFKTYFVKVWFEDRAWLLRFVKTSAACNLTLTLLGDVGQVLILFRRIRAVHTK